jgi:glycosyltransferase involved in cell wall biosynthesis
MLEVLATMQVGIVPSLDSVTRRVAWPVKVCDYLSCGLPIITPGHGEWGQVIADHGCGVVTPTSSGAEFATALQQFADREAWEEMARNAIALVRNEMSWQRLLEPLAQVLRGL